MEYDLHSTSHAAAKVMIVQCDTLADRSRAATLTAKKGLLRRARKLLMKNAIARAKKQLEEEAKRKKRGRKTREESSRGQKLRISLDPIEINSFSCRDCDKTFCSERTVRKHKREKHGEEEDVRLPAQRGRKKKKIVAPPTIQRTTKLKIPTKKLKLKIPPKKRGRPPKFVDTTDTESDSNHKPVTHAPKRGGGGNSAADLTCPTCDRTFPARSVFDRHLRKSRHGPFEVAAGAARVPAFVDPSLPHLNAVTQPTMEVGGLRVNKYECHLCSKVFVRVKDLAKHREKNCTAWVNA